MAEDSPDWYPGHRRSLCKLALAHVEGPAQLGSLLRVDTVIQLCGDGVLRIGHVSKVYPTTEELLSFGRDVCGVSKPEQALERIGDAMASVLHRFRADGRIPASLLIEIGEAWAGGLRPGRVTSGWIRQRTRLWPSDTRGDVEFPESGNLIFRGKYRGASIIT